MRLTQKQLRFIIQEELALVLETKAARDWIAKQDESQRDRLMDWYNAGMKNVSDLAYALKTLPPRFVLDSDLIEAYYSQEFKDILNRYGITQLKDFQEQGYAFVPFMQALVDYKLKKEKDAISIMGSNEKKVIGQVGDWTIIDPVSGKSSEECAEGTTWCTRQPSTYDQYVKGKGKLYYLINDKKEYPFNKLSFGVNSAGIRYGGRGGFSVDASNEGIGSYEEAKAIVGDGIDEIISILLDYYPKDMENRKLRAAHERKNLFFNYINFIRAAKSYDDTSLRIMFYTRVIDSMKKSFNSRSIAMPSKKTMPAHLYKIFKFILKDKEMKNMKFLAEEKEDIMYFIEEYMVSPQFWSRLPFENKVKDYDFIFKSLIKAFTDHNDEVDWHGVYFDLKKLYPKDKAPEDILANLEETKSKAIKTIEDDIEFFTNRKNSVADENEKYSIDRELTMLQDKLQQLRNEEQ